MNNKLIVSITSNPGIQHLLFIIAYYIGTISLLRRLEVIRSSKLQGRTKSTLTIPTIGRIKYPALPMVQKLVFYDIGQFNYQQENSFSSKQKTSYLYPFNTTSLLYTQKVFEEEFRRTQNGSGSYNNSTRQHHRWNVNPLKSHCQPQWRILSLCKVLPQQQHQHQRRIQAKSAVKWPKQKHNNLSVSVQHRSRVIGISIPQKVKVTTSCSVVSRNRGSVEVFLDTLIHSFASCDMRYTCSDMIGVFAHMCLHWK